ncbi:MAG: hypothetical protein KJZ78_27945, partial [Bryobacteraceae bacterium]|nr:hypothetical protein [Bryobacteraceae bacterium]
MKRIFLLSSILMILAGAGFAQEERVRRIFEPREMPQYAFKNLAHLLMQVGHPDTQVVSDEVLRVIVVEGPVAKVDLLEQLVKRFDGVPPGADLAGDFELTVQIIQASPAEQENGNKMTADLQEVVKQVSGILSYKSFRLLDTVVIHGRTGAFSIFKGVLPVGAASNPTPVNFEITVENPSITGGKPPALTLRQFRFSGTVP